MLKSVLLHGWASSFPLQTGKLLVMMKSLIPASRSSLPEMDSSLSY